MKKVLSFVLVLCIMLSALPAFAEEAEGNTIPDTWEIDGNFWVEEIDGAWWVVGISHYQKSITVPAHRYFSVETYNGVHDTPLTLRAGAFKGTEGVHTITFEEGLTSLPSGLCENMPNLTTINLPKSLTAIGNNCFKGCESLVNINLSNVEYIGRGAFEGCTNLKTVKLSTSLETIEAYTFKDCKKLSEINLANVKTIGNDAFTGTGVILPEEKPKFLYSDVNGSDEYTKAVEVLSELGIMEGFDDGTFKPDATLTRAEAAAIMVRALNMEKFADNSEKMFTDVDKTHWANGYIAFCVDNGIVSGLGDGTFDPEAEVTLHQLLKMLVCVSGYESLAVANGAWMGGGYIFAAEKIGLIERKPNNADVPVTRAVVAELVFKVIDIELMEQVLVNNGMQGAVFEILEGRTILTEFWDYNKIECEVREALKNEVTVVVVQNLSNKTDFVTGQYVSFATDADFRDAIGERVTVYATNAKQGGNYILFKVEN